MLIKVEYFSKKKMFLIYNLYTTLDNRSELVCLKKVSILMSYGPFFHPEAFFVTKKEGITIACLK